MFAINTESLLSRLQLEAAWVCCPYPKPAKPHKLLEQVYGQTGCNTTPSPVLTLEGHSSLSIQQTRPCFCSTVCRAGHLLLLPCDPTSYFKVVVGGGKVLGYWESARCSHGMDSHVASRYPAFPPAWVPRALGEAYQSSLLILIIFIIIICGSIYL